VSDGIDGPGFNTHSYEEARAALLDANISVYSLAVGGTSFHKRFSRLFNYSNDSGGQIHHCSRCSLVSGSR
jgi:hypothetical protein